MIEDKSVLDSVNDLRIPSQERLGALHVLAKAEAIIGSLFAIARFLNHKPKGVTPDRRTTPRISPTGRN